MTALWLLPFYPSPLRDDGYDIADYYDVHPTYGTLADFKTFLREAHQRGLRVITELVMNHTSDQHPWFQRARRAKPGSRWRDFYVWSDTPDKYKETRIIFKDVEVSNWTWDHVANAYYWHRFFSHQPDLNYDNPEVFEEMLKVLDFWLDLGVDGVRLDAVPYLYEREGTSCENLPETHAALKKLRAHVDEKYGDRMLLAEANQWPEDAVAYFGQGTGDECHMAFHFPLMPRLFMAVRMEDRTPIVDILEQTPPIPRDRPVGVVPAQPRRVDAGNGDGRGARLHVSDVCPRPPGAAEPGHPPPPRAAAGQRPQAHRTAQRAALLPARHAGALLRRRNRHGREHLPWRPQRRAHADAVEFGQERRLLARQSAGALPAHHLRSGVPLRSGQRGGATGQSAFAALVDAPTAGVAQEMARARRGPVRVPPAGESEDSQLRAPRRAGDACWWWRIFRALCSRWSSTLSAFKQWVPVELFGRTEFPIITDKPYLLTLGPHAFYWFSLESKVTPAEPPTAQAAPSRALTVTGEWSEVFSGKARTVLEGPAAPTTSARSAGLAERPRRIKQVTLAGSRPGAGRRRGTPAS